MFWMLDLACSPGGSETAKDATAVVDTDFGDAADDNVPDDILTEGMSFDGYGAATTLDCQSGTCVP